MPMSRCGRRQTVRSQSDEEPPDTARHHPGRVRGFASGHHRTEISGSDAAARSNTIQQVRIRPMLGFKRFETAAITISGIELAEKIRKHQFKTGKLAGRPKTAPEIWAAILAA